MRSREGVRGEPRAGSRATRPGRVMPGGARGPEGALEAGRLESDKREKGEESRDGGEAPAGVARKKRPSGGPGGVPPEGRVHGFGDPPARSKKTSDSAPPRPEAVSRFRSEPRATSRPSTRRPAMVAISSASASPSVALAA